MIHSLATAGGQGYANSLMPSLERQDYGFDAFLLVIPELQLIAAAQRSGRRRIVPGLADPGCCRDASRRIRPEETSHDGLEHCTWL